MAVMKQLPLVAAMVQLAIVAVVLKADALVVKDLPHFQTFDSWSTCVYDGVCYEDDCSSYMMGGWSTPPLEDIMWTSEVWGWWINSGTTPSNKNATTRAALPCSQLVTGPCTDHTSNSTTGKYLYAEASGCASQTFTVTSPSIVFTNSSATLTFYYYMYGKQISSSSYLQVLMDATTDSGISVTNRLVFNQTGTSTQRWIQASISLDTRFPSTASAANPVTAVFTFKVKPSGSRDSWQSDIAIDDVLFTQSGASSTPAPYIDPSPSPSPSPSNAPIVPVSGGGGGLTDAEIGGIVGGIIGGLILLLLLLGLVLVAVLLVISPKGPGGPAPAPNPVL